MNQSIELADLNHSCEWIPILKKGAMEKTRILIVEDETDIIMEIEGSLRSLGYDPVAIANSGEDAIEKSDSFRPHIILMNIRLQGKLNGITAANIIHSHFHIPIIFLLTHKEETRLELAELAMPFGYLLLPVREGDLKFTVEMALYATVINSEREQAEAALRSSQETWRSLTNNTNDIIQILDTSGNILFMNKVYPPHTLDDVIGTPIFDSMDDASKILAQDAIKKLLAEKRPQNAEVVIRLPGFENAFFNAKFVPIFSRGKVEKIISECTNITERKIVELKLRESEEKYRTVIENSNDAIIVVQDDSFKYVNPKTTKLMGYTKEELSTRSFLEFVHPDDREKLFDRYVKRQRGENLDSVYIVRVIGKNKRILWVEIKPVVISWEGRVATLCYFGDLTARKKALEVLKLYKDIFTITKTPLAIINLDGVYTEQNIAHKNAFGYGDDDLYNETLAIDLGEKAFADIVEVLAEKGLFQSELVGVRKSGEKTVVDFTGFSMKDEDGKTFCYVLIKRDITDRKQAEEALKESEKSLKYAQSVARLGNWEWNFEKGAFTMSDEMCSIFGVTDPHRYSNILDVVDEVVHPGDRERIIPAVRKAVDSGADPSLNYRILKSDGEVRWIEAVRPEVKSVADDGSPMIVVGTVQDTTSRKQAEEEIQQLRKYMSNIIDSMPSAIVGVDLKGNVTQWNREAERVTSIDSHEAVGQPLAQVFPRLREEMELARTAIQNREVHKDTKSYQKLQSETRYEDVTIYPLVTNCVEGAVIRVDDVTERVMVDKMMIQSEKMMSLGALTAGTAHEINNPLGTILFGIQNIERRLSLDLAKNFQVAEQQKIDLVNLQGYLKERNIINMIHGIKESGERAAKIVRNMLQFSRKSESWMTPVEITEVIMNALELARRDYDLKKQYDFRSIKIEKEFDPILKTTLCVESEIEQVVLNLLRNSAQAMANQKTNVPQRIALRTKTYDNRVRIEVEDNGPGMDEETRKRIFEPFFTTKSAGQGTGLGLSVSYTIIVDNHNGILEVESELGKGSKFTIHLPLDGKGL